MVKQYISPAVITNEIDETELQQGLADIAPTIIGVSAEGPAFKPTYVSYWPDFVSIFGKQDPKRLAVYAARLGLKSLAGINMVRVLGPEGTTHTNGNTIAPGFKAANAWAITYTDGVVEEDCMAIIHTSGAYHIVVTDLDAGKLYLEVKNGTGTTVVESTASFNSGSEDYLLNVFNSDPTKYHDANYGYYVHRLYQHNAKNLPANPTWDSQSWGATFADYTLGYNSASTTWITSQPFGSTTYNLFKFHTMGDGTDQNTKLKITLSNVKPSVSPDTDPYGTFDVTVRPFGDTDANMQILEQYSNITLDPSSANYIARRIGDYHEEYDATNKKFVPDGYYPNKSKLIRVELTGSSGAPTTAVPWGFRGYGKMSASIPTLPYVYDLKNNKGIYNSKYAWGVQFFSSSIDERLYVEPNGKSNTDVDADFSLKSVSGSSADTYAYNTAWTGTMPGTSFAAYARFSLPVADGFDGWDIHMSNPVDNTLLGDTATYASASWTARNAFRRGVDVISDEDEIDTNMVVIPGVYHTFVTDYCIQTVEDRADCIYIMAVSGNTKSDVINYMAGRDVDSSYAACYYPHVMIEDTHNNKRVFVDPTTIMPYVFGMNDSLGQPYYAPAGLNRAVLNDVVFGVKERLNSDDRNDLYSARINPIVKFKEGYVVWGQKTLQVKESALTRINIRRLLIHVKKAIASLSRYLVFEQNAQVTWDKFVNKARPIMDSLVSTYGIKRYTLKMDESTVTKEMEEQNIMPGQIKFEPYRAAEIIPLDFILTENGASFNEP